jgi:Mrp family chromosome partitioning ATPase
VTLAGAYDYVILDLPPVGVVTDAVTIAPQTDGIVFVVRENNCPRGLLADCVNQLRDARANILGFVINGALEGSGKKYGYGKNYGGYYGSYGGYYGNYHS